MTVQISCLMHTPPELITELTYIYCKRGYCYLRQCKSYAITSVCQSFGITAKDISRVHWNLMLCLVVIPPGSDSRSLFHLHHNCRIVDFRIFISISQSPADLHDTRRNDWCRQGNESTTCGSDPADIRIQIRIILEIRVRIPDHICLRLDSAYILLIIYNSLFGIVAWATEFFIHTAIGLDEL